MSGNDYALVAGTGCATGLLWSTVTGDLDLGSSKGWLQASLACAGSSISSSSVFFVADRVSEDKKVAYQATGVFWGIQGTASATNALGRVHSWQEEPAFNTVAFPLNFAAAPLSSAFSLVGSVLGYYLFDSPHKSVELYGGRLVFVHQTTLYEELGFKHASRAIGAVGTDTRDDIALQDEVAEHETGHTVHFSILGDLGFTLLYLGGELVEPNPLETWAEDYRLKLNPPFSRLAPPMDDEAFLRFYRSDPFFQPYFSSESDLKELAKQEKKSPLVDSKKWLADLTSGDADKIVRSLEIFRTQDPANILLLEFTNHVKSVNAKEEKTALSLLKLYERLLSSRGKHSDDEMFSLEQSLFAQLPLKNPKVAKQAVISGVLQSSMGAWLPLLQKDQDKTISSSGLRDGILYMVSHSPFFCYRLVTDMLRRPNEYYNFTAPGVQEVFTEIHRLGLVKRPLFTDFEVAQFEDLMQRYRHSGWKIGAMGLVAMGGEADFVSPGVGLWLGYRNLHRLGLRANLSTGWASPSGPNADKRPAWLAASLEPVLHFIKKPEVFDAYLAFELGGKRLFSQGLWGLTSAIGLGLQLHVQSSSLYAGVKTRGEYFPKAAARFQGSGEFFYGAATSF